MRAALLPFLVLHFLLVSCGSRQPLEVKSFHLREVDPNLVVNGEPLIEAERLRRFYGAIGVREQEQRLGHYYSVFWRDDQVGDPVRVTFEYQQGATGSRILRQVSDFPAGSREGQAEFTITGDDYLGGGRILAWKCSLSRGGRVIDTRQSYLWE